MLDTQVEMSRTTLLLSDGSSVYQIDAVVIDKGELLHPNLFVYQILDVLDATRDSFVRVGNPYDLENIYQTRAEAIANAQVYYLSASLQRRYSDLNTAVQAKDAVRSRIDNSVQAWHTYLTEFSGTDTFYHPTAEAAYEQQLKDDYAAARDARIEAEAAVVAADAAIVLAEAAVANAITIRDIYRTDLNFTEQSYEIYWKLYYAAVGTFYTDMVNRFNEYKAEFLEITSETYISTGIIPGLTTGEAAWLDSLQEMEANIATMSSKSSNGAALDPAFGNFHVAVGGLYASQQSVIVTLNVAAANAVTAKKEAEASLASAQTAEDAALAAAVAVCPDFDPASV
jgi:hypothetical protein